MAVDLFIFLIVMLPASGVFLSNAPLRSLQCLFLLGVSFSLLLVRFNFPAVAALMLAYYGSVTMLYFPHLLALLRRKRGDNGLRISRNFLGLSTVIGLLLLGTIILIIDDNHEFLIARAAVIKNLPVINGPQGVLWAAQLRKHSVSVELFAVLSLALIYTAFLMEQLSGKMEEKGNKR